MKLRLVLAFLLTAITLVGVGWYWRSKSTVQPPPYKEKKFEIVENSGGRDLLIAYELGFKVVIPKGWYVSLGVEGPNTVTFKRIGGAWITIRVGPSRDEAKFTTFRDYVAQHYDHEKVPKEPNLEVGGRPAFQYKLTGPHVKESSIVEFENQNHVYKVYTPIEYRDDPGYQAILDSFELLR